MTRYENRKIDRRRFIRNVTVGAVAGTASTVPIAALMRSANAAPTSKRMLIGPLDQAVNARALLCDAANSTCLYPRLLLDGNFAVPEGVLTDLKYAAAADIFSNWRSEDVHQDDYRSTSAASNSSDFVFLADGKLMRQAGRPASLTMPNPNSFRFEVRSNDFAGSYDKKYGNRRSEIVSQQSDGIGEETIWTAFCSVLGSVPGLVDAQHAIIHQWHSSDKGIGRPPVLYIDISKGRFKISTRSSSSLYGTAAPHNERPENGIPVVHYAADIPRLWEKTYVVLQATFGPNGHLNAWINGDKVVDADTPIGYYNDLTNGSGRTILGYPHWGLYTTNQPSTDVVYLVNPEWSTSILIDRIAAPLPVPGLS